jgi:hypothetical protein
MPFMLQWFSFHWFVCDMEDGRGDKLSLSLADFLFLFFFFLVTYNLTKSRNEVWVQRCLKFRGSVVIQPPSSMHGRKNNSVSSRRIGKLAVSWGRPVARGYHFHLLVVLDRNQPVALMLHINDQLVYARQQQF